MNDVKLFGSLPRDVMFSIVGQDKCKAQFTVMTVKKFKDKEFTSYVPCIAWGDTAKLLEKFGKKDVKILVEGSINTRTYDDKDGKKVYTTEVNADRVEFVLGGANTHTNTQTPYQSPVKAQKPKVDTSSVFDDDLPLIDIDKNDLPF